MSKERKARLEQLYWKAQTPWNSFEERKVLKQELTDIGETAAQEEFDAEELNKFSLITVSLFIRSYEFVSKVANGERQLKDSELEAFEKMLGDLPEAAKGFEDQAKIYESVGLKSAANSHREVIKVLEGDYKSVLNKSIQKEKSRRQNSPNDNDGPTDNGGGGQPPRDNSSLNRQIAELNSRIEDLENKVKNTPNSSSDKQHYNQEIKLLKSQLKEKEKEKEKETSKDKNKKGDFPTGLVVGGGIVIFVLLVAVIFLLARNNKNK